MQAATHLLADGVLFCNYCDSYYNLEKPNLLFQFQNMDSSIITMGYYPNC